jgi:hypothetical protein
LHTAKVSAKDVVGNSSDPNQSYSWSIKVDRSAPAAALSGALYDHRNTQLPAGTYGLHIEANDGSSASASTQRSGVASVEVLVDGDQVDFSDQDCAGGNCPMTYDWTLDTDDYTAGHHTVDVLVDDQLGNEHVDTFSFDKPSCCMTAPAPVGSQSSTADGYFGDVDGDTLADKVTRDALTGAVQVALGDGTAFGTPVAWGQWSTAYDLRLADVNADGMDDLVGKDAAGNIMVGLSTGAAFGTATQWTTVAPGSKVSATDVEGDDAADIVARDPNTGAVQVAYSDPDLLRFDAPVPYGSSDPAKSTQFADVDGDGANDLIAVGSNGDVQVQLSEVGDFAPPTTWGHSAPDDRSVRFGDVNGDDMADEVTVGSGGTINVAPATGAGSFGSSQQFGQWDSGYSLQVHDVDGDDSGDMVGTSSLTGATEAAITNAPTPLGPAAEDYTPDPSVSYEPDDTSAAVTSSKSGASNGSKLRIAFMDENRLLYRSLPGNNPEFAWDPQGHPLSTQQALAERDHVYQRMAEAGATAVRFDVYWGQTENGMTKDTDNDGRVDAYPGGTSPGGGTKYFFDKLDDAVRAAHQHDMDVELTLTGAGVDIDCGASKDYNPNGRSCVGPEHQTDHFTSATGDPKLDQYQEFVNRVVRQYTRQGGDRDGAPLAANDPLRVDIFSVWNEPNGRTWLQQGPSSKAVVPTELYRQIYSHGRHGYRNAIDGIAGTRAAVAGTKFWVGELSPRRRTGGIPNSGMTCGKSCPISAPTFLYWVAHATSNTLTTDGIAYHPYQDDENPRYLRHPEPRKGPRQMGIAHLKTVAAMRDSLWSNNALRTPAGKAAPALSHGVRLSRQAGERTHQGRQVRRGRSELSEELTLAHREQEGVVALRYPQCRR